MGSFKQWVHGIAAAFVGGASTAGYTILLAPQTFNFNTKEGLIKLGQAALLGGVVPTLAYLKQFPTPESTITVTASVTTTKTGEQ